MKVKIEDLQYEIKEFDSGCCSDISSHILEILKKFNIAYKCSSKLYKSFSDILPYCLPADSRMDFYFIRIEKDGNSPATPCVSIKCVLKDKTVYRIYLLLIPGGTSICLRNYDKARYGSSDGYIFSIYVYKPLTDENDMLILDEITNMVDLDEIIAMFDNIKSYQYNIIDYCRIFIISGTPVLVYKDTPGELICRLETGVANR